MARPSAAALFTAAALALPGAAAARDPLATFDSAPPKAGADAGGDPRAARPPAPLPPVRFVLQLAGDWGMTTAITAYYTDGSHNELKLNQGVSLGIGASALNLFDGRLSTQAVVGVEYGEVGGTNGVIRWVTYPLEVMEVVDVGPVRLGSGISYLVAPHISGGGIAAGLEARMESSLGWLSEVDYAVHPPGGTRRSVWWIGARYERQRLRSIHGGRSVQADAVGAVVGAAL